MAMCSPIGSSLIPSALTFTGTPPQDFNGSFEIELVASVDNFHESDVFELVIDPVNDAPIAVDDTGFETDEDVALNIAIADILANDSDVDNEFNTDPPSGDGAQFTMPITTNDVIGTHPTMTILLALRATI